MNQTKKITQGAMMLAILGALILVDRITSYLFTELIVLIVPVIVIMYSAMNTFKDGLVLSGGIVIMSFILGNFNMVYLIYTPVGIVTGLVYAYGLSKNKDKRTLMLSAMATYIVGEIISYYVISPLMGISIASMVASYKESLSQIQNVSGMDYMTALATLGINFDKYILVILLISTILMGLMEGLLIHLLSVFMLKRFKIKDIGSISLWDAKPNPVVAYLSFFSLFLIYFGRFIPNETIYYTLLSLGVIGSMVLIYYAYLFCMLFGAIVLKKRIGGFFVILCFFFPPLMILLIILGFLYGSGPLRAYLESKRVEMANKE